MIEIKLGRINPLTIIRKTNQGLILDGGEWGEILYSEKHTTGEENLGEIINAFLYIDNDGRIVASNEKPLAMAEEFAFLRVTQINEHGAFLDWGVAKELFVPFAEQVSPMKVDRFYLVFIYEDLLTHRLVGSAKVEQFLDTTPDPDLEINKKVEVLIWKESPLGFKAIINHKTEGLIYKTELYEPLKQGQLVEAYIKKVREDGKVDLSMTVLGHHKMTGIMGQLMDALKQNSGQIDLTDNSTPEEIAKKLQMSKKNFKKAVGMLYKEKIIELSDNGIRLLK